VSSAVEGVKQPSLVDALDSARDWVILGVVAMYVLLVATLPPSILRTLAINGDRGVVLFYIFSAFFLNMMFNTRKFDGHHNLTGYFIRRFFRIAPMLWLALLLAILPYFGKHTFWPINEIGWIEVALSAIFFARSCTCNNQCRNFRRVECCVRSDILSGATRVL